MLDTPQDFAHHTRWDPAFHFFILPVFSISVIMTIVHLVRHPGLHSAWIVVVMIALLVAIFKIRTYSLKVQDRVIRLEERLRLATLIDPALRGRIPELTTSQLVALRFASDGELSGLATRALDEKLPGREIKKSIQTWRPDHWRV